MNWQIFLSKHFTSLCVINHYFCKKNSSLIYWGRLDLTVGDNVVSACQVENVHL